MHVTDAQQLAFKIYQTETINLSTSTLCLQISPHNDVIPMSFLAAGFTFFSISTGMQILMLDICWHHFNKLALKLQIKTYFQQTWYIYVIMLA